jgi:hypothetical protein
LLWAQYRGGQIDFVPVGYFEQNLLLQQDEAAQAEGDVPLALIDVYRAMGGGWQMRLAPAAPAAAAAVPGVAPSPSEANVPGDAARAPEPPVKAGP